MKLDTSSDFDYLPSDGDYSSSGFEYSDDVYAGMYKNRSKMQNRAKREEEIEDYSFLAEDISNRKRRFAKTASQRSYFWEDFSFNLMHYVLVPLSIVALFGIFVYAEYTKIRGY